MIAIVICLLFVLLLYLCSYLERNDPRYWDMCHGIHPAFHVLLSPICLIIRLTH